MSGFFGFDTAMPDDRRAHQGSGFQAGAEDNFDFSGLGGAGEEEDLAVYQWGDASASLLEGNDDLNDETFGGAGDFGTLAGLGDKEMVTDNRPRLQLRRTCTCTQQARPCGFHTFALWAQGSGRFVRGY